MILKNLVVLLLVLFVSVSLGCRTLGGTRLSGDQVTVIVGPTVTENPEQLQKLRKYHAVEQLYDYLDRYIRGGGLRHSIKFHVTITEFRLGWGRDMMGVEVSVTEHDKELKHFNLSDTTIRGSQVKRLTKSLARRTFDEVQWM